MSVIRIDDGTGQPVPRNRPVKMIYLCSAGFPKSTGSWEVESEDLEYVLTVAKMELENNGFPMNIGTRTYDYSNVGTNANA